MSRVRGFTLLEILIALAIFAVVAALAWGGLDSLARSRRILAEEADKLSELQSGIGRLERDIRQALPRSVRSDSAATQDALAGTHTALELSVWLPSGGWTSAGPEIQRVRWSCSDAGLERSRWASPDHTSAAPRSDAVLIKNSSDCHFRYYPARGPASDSWPIPGQAQVLPRAIELSFSRSENGKAVETFRRLIELPANSELSP